MCSTVVARSVGYPQVAGGVGVWWMAIAGVMWSTVVE